MVAPHDVEIVVIHQCFHDEMRSRSAVEDVAKQMQLVDGEPLYEIAYRDDEVVCALCCYDGLHNHVVILVTLVTYTAVALVHQLLYYVAELIWHFLSDFASCVF